jgi:hypothetical protein
MVPPSAGDELFQIRIDAEFQDLRARCISPRTIAADRRGAAPLWFHAAQAGAWLVRRRRSALFAESHGFTFSLRPGWFGDGARQAG